MRMLKRPRQGRPLLIGHNCRRYKAILRLVDEIDEARGSAMGNLFAHPGVRAHIRGPREC
jgi:hypothetical protein